MKKIVYLHGFASAGSTGSAAMLRNELWTHDVSVLSPDIPVMPAQALDFLKSFVAEESPNLIIGTSMGAMYAEILKGIDRICVNPSFHMAKLITFNHLGKNVEFRNRRADGAVSFKADKQMVAEFKAIEKSESLKNISAEEKKRVWGMFGKDDPIVNCRDEFAKAYGKEHCMVFDGGHNLTQAVIKTHILPIVFNLLSL